MGKVSWLGAPIGSQPAGARTPAPARDPRWGKSPVGLGRWFPSSKKKEKGTYEGKLWAALFLFPKS
jgi:hypothetical protein